MSRTTKLIIISALAICRNLVEAGCGERLGKGVVQCFFAPKSIVAPYDFSLCTHASVHTTFACSAEKCHMGNTTGFEQTVRQLRPHFPNSLGIVFPFGKALKGNLTSHERRLKAATTLINFMTERNMTYVVLYEIALYDSKKDQEENIFSLFIEGIGELFHTRGWHIGLMLPMGVEYLMKKYDLKILSNFVDWFSLMTRIDFRPGQHYVKPYAPLSSANGSDTSTTEYQLTTILKSIKPECILVDNQRHGIKYTAVNKAVEPGPGSRAEQLDPKVLPPLISDICYRLLIDTDCREYWHEESSTPYAVCGDEIYTYDDERSLRLKVALAKKLKIAGMSSWSTSNTGDDICGDGDPLIFLKALQDIRGTTE